MNHKNRWHVKLNILVVVFWLAGCFAVGYGLSLPLFRLTGEPSAFLAYMISAALGILLFCIVAKVMSLFILKGHTEARFSLLSRTVEAMDKIAHGDFAISVETVEHDPFSEVAESVNKMARELGALEAQRQDFISNVSHEIQSPLTSIGGFAALLKTSSLTEAERNHYLDIIEAECRRLSGLSDNLLKLSALDTGTKPLIHRSFRLDKQIGNAVLMLEPQWAAKGITVTAQLDKVTVNADEELLGQVWINLLHNAVKFTPQDGKIDISLAERDGAAECRIKDNGIGIAPSDQIHIFERFYKADKSRERVLGGNGLGLSLCKKITELHGGTITADSRQGVGTTFVVRLHCV